MKKLVKCKNCRNCYVDSKTLKFKCKINKGFVENHEKGIECSDFNSRYIEYPIEVSKINCDKRKGVEEDFIPTGTPVKIRPCNKKYNGKTFLGIYLGRIDAGLYISHSRETKELEITRHFNPAVYVPELREIIFGYESWWSEIKNEKELSQITNDDIENVWYVKMLKGCFEK